MPAYTNVEYNAYCSLLMFIASLSEAYMCKEINNLTDFGKYISKLTFEPHKASFWEETVPSSTFLKPSSSLFSPDAFAVS